MSIIKNKKRSALRKNILREILRTKSRFIAIFAIIGISVGFFAGLKSATPSMKKTAMDYFENNCLMDIRLLSTVGFGEDDIQDLSRIDFVDSVMPGYSSDLIVTQNNIDFVVKVMSVPQKSKTCREPVNGLVLKDGRLPANENECVIESYFLKMSGYKIGDTISFNKTVNGKDTSSLIKGLDYTIVGIVDSPLYLTYLRGNSTIGDGTITFYMFLMPDAFATERYTCVYLRTKASSTVENELSDEYKDLISEEKEYLKEFSEGCIKRFNETTLADAHKKLNDAEKEFSEKKDEAVKKISSGIKALKEGENEFYAKTGEAEKAIEDGEKELEEGRKKLEEGQQQYQEGIEEGKKKLTEGQTKYDEGLAQYNAAKLEYDIQIEQAEKQLASAKNDFDMQYQIFYTSTKPSAETKLTLLKSVIDICNTTIDEILSRIENLKSRKFSELIADEIAGYEQKLAEARQKLDEYQKQYDEGTAMLSDGEKQLSDAKKKLDDAQNQLLEKKAEGARKLGEAKAQLDIAAGQLENGKLEYETGLSTGMLQLQAAQTKLTEGEKKLSAGKEELKQQKETAMIQMKEGREELARGMYEAHVQLDDAEKKLSDAKDSLSELDDAKWYVFDRSDNPGYSGLNEDADRVDNVSKVFPIFFLLIAGLVCFTTMTRMVEEHRTETGTLKALGYSNLSIAMKYVIYGCAAALLGSAAGGALGVLTLPIIIVDTYGIMYSLPPSELAVHWSSLLLSSAAGTLCISLVSLMACLKDLMLYPAALMRPKAPKPGKRILLEYIKPVWNSIHFTSKVTARNLFRYKARFFMTVVGVAGCTALIVAGFGLRDSTTGIAEKQFDNLTIYDQIYALSTSGTENDKAYIMSQFHADDRFDSSMLSYMSWGTIGTDKTDKKQDIRFIIGNDQETFEKMFVLRDRKTKEPLELTNEGIIISERAGECFGIKPGDLMNVRIEDEDHVCKVTSLTENYAGIVGYMSPEYYEVLTGNELKYNIVLTRISQSSPDDDHTIANDYMKYDDIMTVTSIKEQIKTMMDMMKSLDFIIFVIIFCAGLLAVVVLYNLTNINISERVREIATIKVLGFYSLETANFVYRESLILTLIGSLTGLVLGNVFATFIIESIQMDNVMFVKEISFLSYLYAFVLTFAFSMIVNFMMYFKMKKISMVESLKSIE